MMSKSARISVCLSVCALALAGCSNVKETLGMNKRAPDEFAVVTRAPLAMPPDFALRPPEPGAQRPQETAPRQQARQALTGRTVGAVAARSDLSSGEQALLSQAGALNLDPTIRQQIDRETTLLAEESRGVVDSIIFWRKPDQPGVIVDPKKEAQRIQQNTALGRPITEGETPIIQRRKKALFEGIF